MPEMGAPGVQPPLPQDLLTPGDQPDQGAGELACLQKVLDDFPKLLTELQDPQDVEQAVGAMKVLAGIQRRLMQTQGGQGAAPPGQ